MMAAMTFIAREEEQVSGFIMQRTRLKRSFTVGERERELAVLQKLLKFQYRLLASMGT